MEPSTMQRRFKIIRVEGHILGQRSTTTPSSRCPYCGMPKKSIIEEKDLIEKAEDIKAYLIELKDNKTEAEKRKPKDKAILNQVLMEISTLKEFLSESAEHYYMISNGQASNESKSKCKDGYFKIEIDENDPLDIVFNRNDTDSELPEVYETFYKAAANANTVIKALEFTEEEKKKHYINELRSIANVGLGEKEDPKLATAGLEALKNEIVRKEGARIKNKYMVKLGKGALIFMAIAIGGLVLETYMGISSYSTYLCVWIGAMIGTWVSFGIREMSIEFGQLDVIENDMMDSWIRLIFVGVISIIFLMLINSSIITFSAGGLTSGSILGNAELQILLGIICGLIESKLALGIYDKATSIISENKDKNS